MRRKKKKAYRDLCLHTQEHLEIQKLLPVKANWDETVWKGPIDFISSQASGVGESQAEGPQEAFKTPAQGPHEATETPRAGAPSSSNIQQRRKHSKEVHEVGFSISQIV
jgi:hypothetical protein